MVSFQCESCGDVLTKKKLDGHLNRCWDAYFTCIDCMTTFQGTSYRSHTSCMSEAQKYQGALYKEKGRPAKTAHGQNGTQSTTLEVARVEVPPPAPSPPTRRNDHAQNQPINVFDYLVEDVSPSKKASAAARRASPSSESDSDSDSGSDSASAAGNGMSSPTPSPTHARSKATVPGRDFAYGDGPVPRTLQTYESMQDLDAAGRKNLQKTPAPASTSRKHPTAQPNGTTSEKKRKRVEDLDLSVARRDRSTVLHSGLTGGLSKLLADPSEYEEASPLSPKKRSKKSKDSNGVSRHPADDTSKVSKQSVGERERRHKKRGQRTLEAAPRLKAIEAGPRRKPARQSHSEFFLSLVDKPHDSSKGQSIWGALKMFREGVAAADGADDVNTLGLGGGGGDDDTKRLFRGLRMKLGKHGEIVLFARPDKEIDGAG